MLKIITLLAISFSLLFSGIASASFFKDQVSTDLNKKVLVVSIKNSYPVKVKMTIVFSNKKKKSLTGSTGICNRKRPPDCFYQLKLNKLGAKYSKRAVYRLNNGKRFRLRVKYRDEVIKYRCQGSGCQIIKR